MNANVAAFAAEMLEVGSEDYAALVKRQVVNTINFIIKGESSLETVSLLQDCRGQAWPLIHTPPSPADRQQKDNKMHVMDERTLSSWG